MRSLLQHEPIKVMEDPRLDNAIESVLRAHDGIRFDPLLDAVWQRAAGLFGRDVITRRLRQMSHAGIVTFKKVPKGMTGKRWVWAGYSEVRRNVAAIDAPRLSKGPARDPMRWSMVHLFRTTDSNFDYREAA